MGVRGRVKAAAATVAPGEEELAHLDRQADALETLGNEKGDNAALVRAVMIRRKLVCTRPREQDPRAWAVTQNNLGNAPRRLKECLSRLFGKGREPSREAAIPEPAKKQRPNGGKNLYRTCVNNPVGSQNYPQAIAGIAAVNAGGDLELRSQAHDKLAPARQRLEGRRWGSHFELPPPAPPLPGAWMIFCGVRWGPRPPSQQRQ